MPTFIKWAGGKSQLLEQFAPLFPEKIDNYIEPFLGSGAVFFENKRRFNPKRILLSDINEELINTFRVVRDNVDELIALLKQHKEEHNPDYYYDVRSWNVIKLNEIQKAARTIYLNKTCFNGLYRVNSKGLFNVPIGSYKNPAILQEDILREASILLQGVKLKAISFEKIVDIATNDSFIYFDPPYFPLSKTSSFTTYTKGDFLEDEQRKLAEIFRRLDRKGCKLMLSNSDTPLIHELYSEYEDKGLLKIVRAKRMISCVGTGRGAINEVVVLNYD